jgi:hypothetical protein
MRLEAFVSCAWLALAACSPTAEVPPPPPTPTTQAMPVESVAKVPAHCLPVGGALDPALIEKQAGCPCDAKWQRDSCVEGTALICGAQGTWQSPEDGPCGQGMYPSVDCEEAIAQGKPSESACACVHDICRVARGNAHVCSGGRWLKVAVADCWRRMRAR